MKPFLMVVITFLVTWCFASFVQMELNPANWGIEMRFGYVTVSLFSSLFVLIFYFQCKDDYYD